MHLRYFRVFECYDKNHFRIALARTANVLRTWKSCEKVASFGGPACRRVALAWVLPARATPPQPRRRERLRLQLPCKFAVTDAAALACWPLVDKFGCQILLTACALSVYCRYVSFSSFKSALLGVVQKFALLAFQVAA